MSSQLAEMNLQDDLRMVQSCEEAARWKIEKVGGQEILVTLSPAGKPEESYQARLLWARYPEDPPSLKFRDPASGRLDMPIAWPVVRGFRPSSLDACVNWCAEGFNLHPEWRNDPRLRWDPRGNAVLRVLRVLQSELDEHFQQRFHG